MFTDWFTEPDETWHCLGLCAGTLLLRPVMPLWATILIALGVILGRELYKYATRPVWDRADTIRDVRAGILGAIAGLATSGLLSWGRP